MNTAKPPRSDSVARPTVAVVGVGAMGLPMALRLHANGLAVRAVDVSPQRVAECRAAGIRAGEDIELVVGADVILAMVATRSQLDDLMAAAVVTEGRTDGAVLVVASTVGPDAVRAVADVALRHGVRVLDCPVTGGVVGAATGTLTLFAAGDSETLSVAEPVLAIVGTVRAVGDRPGDGQAFKLVNQMLTSIHLVAAAEAMAFAERLGLDLDVVQELLLSGAAASWMLADRWPRMLLRAAERRTVTQLSIFVKDSGLVADAVDGSGSHAPLTAVARAAWLRAAELGLENLDDTSIVDVFRPAP